MEHLIEQNRLLGELTRAADPSTPVPTCPGWTLRQLVTHVGRGDRWAAAIVRERSAVPVDIRTVADGKPPEGDATAWLAQSAQLLVDAVARTGGDVPVWTFTGPQPAAWWLRRRLHEATVHRADAAVALGVPYDLAPELAADGVSEWLELLGARPGPAPLDDGVSLHLHASDAARTLDADADADADADVAAGAEGEWTVRVEGGRVVWERGHAKGDAAVRGRAVDLLLAILRRPAEVEVLGEVEVWTTWLSRTGF